jgi:hypothetical protein
MEEMDPRALDEYYSVLIVYIKLLPIKKACSFTVTNVVWDVLTNLDL